MSQMLTLRTRKDGKSKGVMIRKNPSMDNNNNNNRTLKDLFQFAYIEHLKRLQDGESKNQIA